MNPCVVFIHAATLPRCQERIDQYLSLMVQSKLAEFVKHIYIDCVGKDALPDVSNYDTLPITVTRIHENLDENEFPTQHHMWTYAKANPDSFLLYLHTKGVGKDINPAIEDWVSYMTYFLIEKWRVCVEELESNKTAGVDLRPEFCLHYSGNFWWSRADWIMLLPDPFEFSDLTKYSNPLQSKRHQAEFWICSDGFHVGHANLWSSHIHVGSRHLVLYPRERYHQSNL